MIRNLIPFILFALFVVVACDSGPERQEADALKHDIYYEYQIIAGEDSDVNVLLQYRKGGQNGEVFLLDSPVYVKVDNEVLYADSARLAGVYYETQKPLNEFAGKHSIVIYNGKNIVHSKDFEFSPFFLDTDFSGLVSRGDWVFQFKGVEENEKLRLVLIDTSFETKDINDEFPILNGQIKIGQEALKNIANGPVTMEIYREKEQRTDNQGRIKGVLSTTYSLKREFELID